MIYYLFKGICLREFAYGDLLCKGIRFAGASVWRMRLLVIKMYRLTRQRLQLDDLDMWTLKFGRFFKKADVELLNKSKKS